LRHRAPRTPARARAVARGGPSLQPPTGLEARVFKLGEEELVVFSLPQAEVSLPGELSAAEKEVAELIVRGLSNSEIAAERGTALRTVANQVQAIFTKLGVGSRGELIALLTGR
jgi:DNA-binding NarL/FixJ family response regulator